MSEHLSKEPKHPDYATRNVEYFLGHPSDAEDREEYERRGPVPTNNLNLYIVDDPDPEFAPGIPNPHDYRQRSFGPIIETLRQEHSELWDEARDAIQLSNALLREYGRLLSEGKKDEAAGLSVATDEAVWTRREACDRIFRIIAPQMQAAGIDPLEICI